jgi:phage N-6-adenine-methyltransferase
MGKVYHSSAKMDWATPASIYDPLNEEFGFTLDVCADRHNRKCDDYFSVDDDGLEKEWAGTCWMNPPYGRELKQWIAKAYCSKVIGVTTVCLVPARTDTKWWSIFWDHDLHEMRDLRDEVRFVKGRIRFEGAPASAPFPSAVIVLRGVTRGTWCSTCGTKVYASAPCPVGKARSCGRNQDFFNDNAPEPAIGGLKNA